MPIPRATADDLRASDADRERVVTRLQEHAAAGRLDAAELEQRVAAALWAKGLGELARLETDLPPVATSAPARRRRADRTAPDGQRPYLAVMLLLVAIWALTGAGYFWPLWPALGWGIGLLTPGGMCGAHGRRRRLAA